MPETVSDSYSGKSVLDAINLLLADYPEMEKLVLVDSEIKPGLLLFAGKTELKSMELLDEILDEDITIRIVPILHGG